MDDLSGKVAIITGSANNIGRAIALKLAERGADIVVHGKTNADGVAETVRLVKERGTRAVGVLADLTEAAGADSLLRAATDSFNRADILVNNAALRRNQPLLEMSESQWSEVIVANLWPSFFMTRAVIPMMLKAGWGRIVNLGGIASHGIVLGRAHVATAKAGLIGFTKAVALEYAGKDITVNCVVPGSVRTERGAAAGAKPTFSGGRNNLAGREGTVDEVAHIVAMLCAPDAAYMTGQTLHVSGGAYLP